MAVGYEGSYEGQAARYTRAKKHIRSHTRMNESRAIKLQGNVN